MALKILENIFQKSSIMQTSDQYNRCTIASNKFCCPLNKNNLKKGKKLKQKKLKNEETKIDKDYANDCDVYILKKLSRSSKVTRWPKFKPEKFFINQ